MGAPLGRSPANMISGTSSEQGLERGFNSQQGHEMNVLHTLRDPTITAEPTPGTAARTEDPNCTPRRPWRFSIASPRIDAPLPSARDHLANERVFLAYFRTSSALATFSVVVLQLYRLGHDSPPPGVLSDYKIGIPLASTILLMAILMIVLGAARFFKCQNSITASRIVGSGQMVSLFTTVMIMVSFNTERSGHVSLMS